MGAGFLHAFGQRYDLPISLSLYLYAAAGVVLLSFVMVVAFAGHRTGAAAVAYPVRHSALLTRLARSRWPTTIGGAVGVLGLLAIAVTGWFGDQEGARNPAEYLLWIYFWAGFVILVGLLGNLWELVNPWRALYRLLRPLTGRAQPLLRLPPGIGIWPAVAAFFGFACLELTSGLANRPALVATLAVAYTVYTLTGMMLFGPESWLRHADLFTVLFGIIARFGPLETRLGRDGPEVFLRPPGTGLLGPAEASWSQVAFVIFMLSSLAFDGVIATPAWQNLAADLAPYWERWGQFGFFLMRTAGLLGLSLAFLLIFVAFMLLVVNFGGGAEAERLDLISVFALTLVPIALVYNAAHNYSYLTVQAQNLIPLLADPLGRGWHWLPTAGFRPSFLLAGAALVWYVQVVLIVLGHVIAVYLAHLRALERFRAPMKALFSQYPMLILMVLYTMTSLWILAQPITREGG